MRQDVVGQLWQVHQDGGRRPEHGRRDESRGAFGARWQVVKCLIGALGFDAPRTAIGDPGQNIVTLAWLGALDIRMVRRAEGEDLFNHLIHQYHYLGFSRPVGEHLKYLVLAGERPIACMAWNSGPLKLNLRDELVGAPRAAYAHNLHLIAYNSRYLIAPWVKVPHLASHVLARIARRISADWQALYHHPIHLLESFVDIERFKGTCYRAANWQCVGRSEGRGTKSKARAQTSIKELWVYALSKDFRTQLLQAP